VSVYKRGDVWWYKFTINGQRIRESAKSNSKTVAKGAELARRRELEQAYNHIPKRERVPLFSNAADLWLAGKTGLAPKSTERYEQCVSHLKEEFGKRLVCDIAANEVAEYQRKRLAAGVSNRTVNYEVGSLRGILRQFGLWAPISDRVRALPERHDVGRAISAGDEAMLIVAASGSRSPALLPLLVISLDTGMRASEVQSLRHRDLTLTWVNGNIASGELIVPKSKTVAGTGRYIPFTRRVCACLSLWLPRFPEATLNSFVFPFYQVGIGGDKRTVGVYDVDLERPTGSWRKAWLGACKKARAHYRWHDLRHTFVSRLAESPAISEQTIKALAGHVSRQMLEHYSHIRSHAKQAAIRCLENQVDPVLKEGGHKIGHSDASEETHVHAKSLEAVGGPARI
jgi:integrase